MSRLRWGGSTPNHPAALRLGTQMGSDSPGQHEYIFSLEVSCLDPENHTRHTRRGEVRLAAAVPEGHCGGFGTSSRMWCGTLKRLGTRPRWTRQPRAPAAGVQLEEYDSDLSAPTGRLGCRRGSPQSPRREAPTRAGTCSVSPRAGPPATNEAPLARRTAAPPLTDLLKWTVRQFGG